jgi:hypothetical protein
MIVEGLKQRGLVRLLLTDQNGKVKTDYTYKNYIADNGTRFSAGSTIMQTGSVTGFTGNSFNTASAHGLLPGDEVIFGGLGTITGATAGTLYYVVNVTSTTAFSVAVQEGGTPVTLGGTTNAATYRFRQNQVNFLAVGTGSNNATFALGRTATGLTTETGVRKLLTVSRVQGGTITQDAIQYQATFGAGESTGALNEAGLFNTGAIRVTNFAQSGTTVTINTDCNHGLATNDVVTINIANASPGMNGSFTVTVVSATQFTYTNATSQTVTTTTATQPAAGSLTIVGGSWVILRTGVMVCRTVFGGGPSGVINKGANDTLQITWTVTSVGS